MNKKMMAVTATMLMTISAAGCSKPATTAEAPAAAAPAVAAETSEADMKAVLDRHVTNVKAANVDAVMADYADDAILVSPPGLVNPVGTFVGKEHVREFFTWLATPEVLPGAQSMVVTTEKLGANTMYFGFTQWPGTPKEVKGYDIYVFRDGKILVQTTFVTSQPK